MTTMGMKAHRRLSATRLFRRRRAVIHVVDVDVDQVHSIMRGIHWGHSSLYSAAHNTHCWHDSDKQSCPNWMVVVFPIRRFIDVMSRMEQQEQQPWRIILRIGCCRRKWLLFNNNMCYKVSGFYWMLQVISIRIESATIHCCCCCSDDCFGRDGDALLFVKVGCDGDESLACWLFFDVGVVVVSAIVISSSPWSCVWCHQGQFI